MKTAIVYIRGLNTHADSDWCGIRAFLENQAAQLDADLIGLDYDDYVGVASLDSRLIDYDAIYGAGHSHGAAKLYEWLKASSHRLRMAVFLDLCPPWQPAAWMGPPWDAPTNADSVLVFYQRNDTPLAGVRLVGSNVQETDLTAWGLHHSTLCADSRVHDRIALAILWDRARTLNTAAAGAAVAGGG